MKIAVYGAGGVGGYYGAALARAGHEVALIARGPHLQAIRSHGLRIRSPGSPGSPGGDFLIRPALATANPSDVGPADAVVVAVKSIDLSRAAERMGPLLGEDQNTLVIPLLNGVDAHEILAGALGRRWVGKGLTRIISRVSAPGEVSHEGLEPYIAMAEWDGSASPRANALVSALREAGVQAEVPPDIDVAIWQKFLMVCSLGGVCAACRQPAGPVRTQPESRALLRWAMEEIVALAAARGVALPRDAVDKAMALADSVPTDGTSSLHRDIVDGRPSELDDWSGAVVRLAAESGVSVPTHGFVYAVLRPSEQAARQSFRENRPGQ